MVLQARPLQDRAAGTATASPKIIAERLLLGDPGDASAHGGNLVLEASPSLLDDVVYIASGAGHVYGMRRSDLKVVWDYRTGSDMDGTPVPTSTGKLLVAVEKQYISGHGGILMLDPSKDPADSVVWFFPTGDRNAGRLGGRRDRVGGRQRHLRPVGPPPPSRRLHRPSTATSTWSRRTRRRAAAPGPQRRRAVPHPAASSPSSTSAAASARRSWWTTPSSPPATTTRIHLYKIKYKTAEKGDEGALKSPSGDWYTVSVTEKDALRRRRRLREHPGDVEGPRLHRLPRRLALLRRRRLTPSLTARDRPTARGV